MAEPLKARLDLALRRRFAFLSMPIVATAADRPAAALSTAGNWEEHVEALLHDATYHDDAGTRGAALEALQALESQFAEIKARYAQLLRIHRSAFDRDAAAAGDMGPNGLTVPALYVSQAFDLGDLSSEDDDEG